MSLDQIITHIRARSAETGAAVLIEDEPIDGVRRVHVTRAMPDETRYMQVRHVSEPDAPYDYAILGGAFSETDPSRQVEGRRGGDLAHAIDLFDRWLFALDAWRTLPYFEDSPRYRRK